MNLGQKNVLVYSSFPDTGGIKYLKDSLTKKLRPNGVTIVQVRQRGFIAEIEKLLANFCTLCSHLESEGSQKVRQGL
jgi:hypothetical protein